MAKTISELQAEESKLVAALQDLDLEALNADDLKDATEKGDALEAIRAEIKKAQDIEAKNEASNRIAALLNAQNTGTQKESPRAKKVVVPARAKARRSLKAFDNEKDAYIAGRCYAANIFNHEGSKNWLNDHGIVATAYSGNNDQKGGLFSPVELETAIIRLVEQFGVFRRFAQVVPMASSTKIHPVRTGGMTAYAVGESDATSAETGTASSADYKKVELVARKWKVRTRISDELNEDSLVDIAEQITLESAQALAEAEDDAGFNGDGTSTYHGIKGLSEALQAGSVLDLEAGEQAFADLSLADFEKALGMVPDYPGLMPAWFISKPGYYASMARLKNAAGGNAISDLESGDGLQFMGYPVVFSQKMHKGLADVASTFLCYVGDLRMATVFGDRRDVTISADESCYWDEDMIGIKATERMDIKVHSTGDATNTGAIVGIKTNAS